MALQITRYWRVVLWLVPGLAAVFGLMGCNSMGYYAQSIGGQLEVLEKRRSIVDVVADPATPAALQEKLLAVQQIRDFASEQLQLPQNDSYRSYADLDRPFAVWNVFAAPPFEVKLKEWCFLFAGCVGYRGYFDESEALQYAEGLAKEGLETYVAGVAAYSTLGWFDDPLLNTIVNRTEARLAGLIFHELAHQQLYVKGDTAFNEAFAITVELEGVRRWLVKQADLAIDKEKIKKHQKAYYEYRQRQADFVDLVTKTRDALEALYLQALDKKEKIQRKLALRADLRHRYQNLKQQWGGYAGYDDWFSMDLNNAQLAAVTTYRDYVPAFQGLLARHGGDLTAFYRACADLGQLSLDERQVSLHRLGNGASGIGGS